MIKLIITFPRPLPDYDSSVNTARKELFTKYRVSGKIITDFIYISNTTLELRFDNLESAQAFEQEARAVNETAITFEYV